MNENKPFITFIIPAFNAEIFIPKILTSLLEQTSKNFEVIVVNDGSTDETYNVCKSFFDKFRGRLMLLSIENQGPFNARMYGVKYAKGSFVAFLDCDDLVEKDYVRTIENVTKLNTNKIDVIIIDMLMYHKKKLDPLLYTLDLGQCFLSHDQYGFFLVNGQLGFTPLKIYHRDVFNRLDNVEINKDIIYGEDLFLSLKLFSNQDTVYYSKAPLYKYMLSNSGLSSTNDFKRALSLLFLNDEKIKFMKEQLCFTDEKIISVIKSSLLHFFKIISRLEKKKRKILLQKLSLTYLYTDYFKNKRDLTDLFSNKDRVSFFLIKVKYFFKRMFKI